MPAPLDPDKRAAIVDAINAGASRNAIAREHGVSGATVSKIAKDEGLDQAFDRSATKRATAAREADNAATRADLKAHLLEDAHRLRRQLWQPCEYLHFGGKDNKLGRVKLEQPTFEQQRNIMTSVGIAVDKIEKLERLDAGGGLDEAQGLIRDLVAGITAMVPGA